MKIVLSPCLLEPNEADFAKFLPWKSNKRREQPRSSCWYGLVCYFTESNGLTTTLGFLYVRIILAESYLPLSRFSHHTDVLNVSRSR